jgi:hypothetical protein
MLMVVLRWLLFHVCATAVHRRGGWTCCCAAPQLREYRDMSVQTADERDPTCLSILRGCVDPILPAFAIAKADLMP